MHVPLLDELTIIAGLAVAVTVILSRLKLPTVAGLLLSGALAGPFGFRLVKSVQPIEVLAEVGVVLLLFTIGLEFSLGKLKNIFQKVALGGALQVVLTTTATALVAVQVFDTPWPRGIYYGFILALSSTAIVLRALSERRELDAPHGRFIVGTLILQDLFVIPMVLVVPFLRPGGDPSYASLSVAITLSKATGLVVLAILLARFLVPRLLSWVDASRSREVFILAILALCIGTAWLTSVAGLSLALGAFLGGMVIADTAYGHRAMGDVLPLRDVFVSIFFVSLGMLFDVRTVLESPALVVGLLFAFVICKGAVATLCAQIMRFPARVAWLAGAGLAQFGEFGFVLAKLGEMHGVVSAEDLRPFITAGIASMFLTPLLLRAAPHITAGEKLLAPLERIIGVRSIEQLDEGSDAPSQHVVLVGYGLAGQQAARALAACSVPYVVLELNAETVRKAKQEGVAIYYADATSEEALQHAHLEDARALVLLMNDPQGAQRVVGTAKRVAPNIRILMRTRYLSEAVPLSRIGATEVVAEEVESAVEVVARLLRWLEVPRNVIEERIHDVRRNTTQLTLRTQTLPRATLGAQRHLDALKVESYLVRPGSAAVGRSVVDLQLRSRTGALMVALLRREELLEQPDPTEPFEENDVVYLVGTAPSIRAAIARLESVSEQNDDPA